MLKRDVAKKYNVHKSMVTRWKSQEKQIYGKYSEDKLLTKYRRGDKHKALFKTLYDMFTEAKKWIES